MNPMRYSKKRPGICLDCRAMCHSRDDWETGTCNVKGMKITHINNRTLCNDYICPKWRYDNDPVDDPDEYEDDSYDYEDYERIVYGSGILPERYQKYF